MDAENCPNLFFIIAQIYPCIIVYSIMQILDNIKLLEEVIKSSNIERLSCKLQISAENSTVLISNLLYDLEWVPTA